MCTFPHGFAISAMVVSLAVACGRTELDTIRAEGGSGVSSNGAGGFGGQGSQSGGISGSGGLPVGGTTNASLGTGGC